jgi:hypothetical protein
MKFKLTGSWGVVILISILIICITLIILAYHSYQINFSMTMDNNTLEAVKSINWSAIPK